jgi:hypothetical protein
MHQLPRASILAARGIHLLYHAEIKQLMKIMALEALDGIGHALYTVEWIARDGLQEQG